MRCSTFFAVFLTLSTSFSVALRWSADQVRWNLNQREDAITPTDYWGEWDNHTYHPSPSNWRFPFYVITIDRYVDGDPTNNDANGTVFEHNWMSNQLRFGGDVRGLMRHLDYIQGMGIKALYLAGSPFINMPWSGDGYGPLDFTLLDHHHGDIEDWRAFVTEVHDRDMYVIIDNTMGTMGDLVGFEQSMNASAPFIWDEYDFAWKSDREYHDFRPGNDHNSECKYPDFYDETGWLVGPNITQHLHDGCKDSDFDQYGDMKGVGAYPSWRTQLSKFASVQDRLRVWKQDVLDKVKVMSCMQIAMLDLDGFRMDKALQTTVDAQAEFATYQRECARQHGKDNFLIVGEAVGEIPLSAVYMGRGRQPDQKEENFTLAVTATNETKNNGYLRDWGQSALDGAAFHYPTYGAMTRWLQLDGPIGFEGVDWVDHWQKLTATDDMVNANTGEYDPRHMFGMTNQDVFRWPALENGTQRQALGFFVTTLEMPGISMILWGEEQDYDVIESLSPDYVFGRTPMASQRAWQLNGCYHLGEEVYINMPFNSSGTACSDDTVSMDHRDPSHPVRNLLKRMYELRVQYPTLNDGFMLETLSSRTYDLHLPGSGEIPTPVGIWSVYRGRVPKVQDLKGGRGNQGVWFIYHNENKTVDYEFDCSSPNNTKSLISPFAHDTTVKNLFYPYEEYDTVSSAVALDIEKTDSAEKNGCLEKLTLLPWGYKALVPKDQWEEPAPTITRVIPRHDARIHASVPLGLQDTVPVEIRFSSAVDCDSIADNLALESTAHESVVAALDKSSVSCAQIHDDQPGIVGGMPSEYSFKATLVNVGHGVHTVTVKNATSQDGKRFTGANDQIMFRIGAEDNPMIFPLTSNYTRDVLHKDESGSLYVSHKAAGAELFRYSTNWGSTYSQWLKYDGSNTTLIPQAWTGTEAQKWSGEHVVLNYWSDMTGSSDHVQHADLGREDKPPRRWPHVFVQGPFNQFGYDSGLDNVMHQDSQGLWEFDFMTEWPSQILLNVWGMNPNGAPDKTGSYGDVNGNGVLDFVAPDSLALNVINVTKPRFPHLAQRLVANDGNFNFHFEGIGSFWVQLIMLLLLVILPLAVAVLCVLTFRKSFYQVKFNKIGVTAKRGFFRRGPVSAFTSHTNLRNAVAGMFQDEKSGDEPQKPIDRAIAGDAGAPNRRTVLIATMEYDIEDWNIKIKIGGLGVMAQLMGKNLGHQDLVWVVPCCGGIDYPTDQVAEPMIIRVMDHEYEISVQYHKLRNITYVLLDAPIFRKQTKTEPYPARMDDLDSAVYYSAWNACIAETIKRFPIDLYHINDYHGAIAPLHLLPRTIPVCLSLHNAEFQGLWSLRKIGERQEICKAFNLTDEVVRKYVQFGEVFNLLHAGASYLRIHQKGFGAVGVSKKYGKRSWARYPIFWGLPKIGSLPNPDPTDTAHWSSKELEVAGEEVAIDEEAESNRGNLRKQAQEWAGLNVDPDAELFVFVGRWSLQKGIDLIADVFFSVLDENPKAQLICIGPVIDLYGKFAALKLEVMMKKYPGRVFSKPEFTMLPPCIFSGAEFALIPSRDEPFGLVAVEFGRKGALGVGAKVGGLGQMPGWWFNIESTATKHLLRQFKIAVKGALASKPKERAVMRARSALQRFPVVQWVEDLEKLQSTSINIHDRQAMRAQGILGAFSAIGTPLGGSRTNTAPNTAPNTEPPSPIGTAPSSRAASPEREGGDTHGATRSRAIGPGHESKRESRRLTKRASMRSPAISRSSSLTSLTTLGNDEPPTPIIPREFTIEEGEETNFDDNAESPVERRSMPPLPPIRTSDIPPPSATYSPSSTPATPRGGAGQHLLSDPSFGSNLALRLSHVTGEGAGSDKRFSLQKVDPFFTDSTGLYYRKFEKMLESVNAKSSESELCIEDYLTRSEKGWFSRFHQAKLGKSSAPSTPSSSVFKLPWTSKEIELSDGNDSSTLQGDSSGAEYDKGQFLLGDDYRPPNAIKRFMMTKIGDWQIYSFILALGQIIAANSYQVTLLTGQNGQSATMLYCIASIYLGASIGWWVIFRRLKSVYALSLPFLFYGSAFFIIGMGPYTTSGRAWINNVGTALYAIGSASGSIFFALNFGTEGGAAVENWVFRACVIQGTQQVYVAALWYWGHTISAAANAGAPSSTLVTSKPVVTAVTTPIAILLWGLGLLLFLGLPPYYQQTPGKVPSFYSSLLRRNIVLWFFVMVVLQNYWLAAPYGRNWSYLWSSNHAPAWAIVILIIVFFIGIWSGLLTALHRSSKKHSWLLPIFALGLGAPRWCQILWGTSGLGAYVPPGGAWGAIIGRSVWLWLGTLDAIQGVGIGMMLLQTLTRFHITCVLIVAQVIGSVATIAGRASAPDATGPGPVFPDFATSVSHALGQGWFWGALLMQLAIPVGFFMFFRKEQLFKP